MLNLTLNIQNPFSKDISTNTKKPYYCSYYPITRNKFFELECGKYSSYDLLKVQFDTRWRGSDHAGIGFVFDLWGWMFIAYIRDSRHWDYKNGTWKE